MAMHVVLLEPEIPQNTGNIARTCAATGYTLHLIEPLGFSLADRYLKRAGLDYWRHLTYCIYSNADEFFKEHANAACWFFTTKATQLYTQAAYATGDYLFFGKETAGLPASLLAENAARTVRIPMRPEIRSLNLSNSVAVAVYEALRQTGNGDARVLP